MEDVIVVHYSEIALKGKNRERFEKQLIHNLKSLAYIKKVYRRYGRIIIENFENKEELKSLLKIQPGIAYFAFAKRTELDIEEIKKAALELLKKENIKTFKIQTKRSFKQFPLTSLEVNKAVGKFLEKMSGKKADYKQAEKTIFVEICEKEAFIYKEKIKGIGGLPIGSSAKVIVLLSGGIDSAVATFLMMKRGCSCILLHFFNKTLHTEAALNKVKQLAKILSKIQSKIKLILIPFYEIQKEIISNIPTEYRMIIYRRFMHKIAAKIAEKENAKAIITGDNIAQVASQTLENLDCIYKATNVLTLSPLFGMNKEEIVEIAKKIKTYEISILPYADCCSFMIAKHPKTKARIEDILKLEELIKNKEKLINKSIEEAKELFFKFP